MAPGSLVSRNPLCRYSHYVGTLSHMGVVVTTVYLPCLGGLVSPGTHLLTNPERKDEQLDADCPYLDWNVGPADL